MRIWGPEGSSNIFHLVHSMPEESIWWIPLCLAGGFVAIQCNQGCIKGINYSELEAQLSHSNRVFSFNWFRRTLCDFVFYVLLRLEIGVVHFYAQRKFYSYLQHLRIFLYLLRTYLFHLNWNGFPYLLPIGHILIVLSASYILVVKIGALNQYCMYCRSLHLRSILQKLRQD